MTPRDLQTLRNMGIECGEAADTIEAQQDKIRVLRDELTEVLEWAVRERASLRDQEITSIRRALEKTK